MEEEMSGELDTAKPKLAKEALSQAEFRFERVFETRALTCGKVQQTQGSCAHNRKSS